MKTEGYQTLYDAARQRLSVVRTDGKEVAYAAPHNRSWQLRTANGRHLMPGALFSSLDLACDYAAFIDSRGEIDEYAEQV